MVAKTKFSAAYLALVQMALVNSGGIVIADGLPSAGSGAGMKLYKGPLSAGGETPDPQRLNVVAAAGNFKHTYQVGSTENPTMNLETAMMDLELRAMLTGTKVETLGDWQIGVMGSDQDGFEPQICVLVSAFSVDEDTGAEGWVHELFPLVKLTSKPFQMQQSESNFTYAGIANQASRKPWGPALSTATNGATKAAVIGPITSENPITMDTYVGNGTTDTYTLQYKPAGDESTEKVKAFLAYESSGGTYPGTAVSLTDVDVDTGIVTFSSAPAADDIVVFLYETASGELP